MAADDVPQRVIYAKEIVGLGTQFGPYPGKDAKERKYSEWMAFVRKAKTRNEANLISFVSDSQKYFRSCKIIQPFDTFIVWDEDSAESEGLAYSNAQTDLQETQDVNGGAPRRMRLRAKKNTTSSPDVAKADSTKPVKNAKEIKMDSISIGANASCTDKMSGKSGHTSDNSIDLDWIKPVTCSDCSEGFVSQAGLAFHRLLHGQDRQCITCGNKFTIHENLQQHLLSHTSEKFTTCDQCFRFFDKEFDLTTAAKLNFSKSYQRLKPPLCNECESYIIINRDITIAKQISGELICNYCGRVYFSRKALNIHLDKHNSKYCCRKCGKVFGTYNAITRHVVVHTNFKPFKCELCGKMFASVLKQQHHANLCGKRSKRKEKVLANTPVNGATVSNEKSVNPSSTIANNSLPSKVHNTRSSSRSKPGSPTIGNEKTDALDCGLVDESSLSSPPLGGAKFFHCQLENNNIFSNGNIHFPFASEQVGSSQQRFEGLNFHRSSSRCNEDVAAQKTPNLLTPNEANHFESSSVGPTNNFVLPIEVSPDSTQSTEPLINSESEPSLSLKLNGISFHDCCVKITSLYDCPRCSKVYASSEGLAMHSLTHFCGKTCTNCGNEFALHRRMKNHLLGHSSEDIKDCFKCQKFFGVPFSYEEEIDACDNAGCLLCDDCDKVACVETSEKDSLVAIDESLNNMKNCRDHLTTHANEFLCHGCGRCFPSWEKLEEHLCEYAANENEDLNEIQTSSTSMQNVFLTDHTYSYDKNDHSEAVMVASCGMASKAPHENGETTFYFECSDCKRSFLTEAATSLHTLLHMGQLCNLCGDHIQHDFELIYNNVPQNGLLCTRCNRV